MARTVLTTMPLSDSLAGFPAGSPASTPWRAARALLFVSCALLVATGTHSAAAADPSKDPSKDPWAFLRSAEPPAADADSDDAADADTAAPNSSAPTTVNTNAADSGTASSGSTTPVAAALHKAALEATQHPELALPDPATLDWTLLTADPATLPAPPGRPPTGGATTKSDAAASTWSQSDKPAGYSAVSVKQPVLPFWDTKVGADLNVAGQSSLPAPLPEKLITDPRLSQSSGAAWASATAPGLGSVWDKTAIEARLDPSQEQSKLGTSISKSVPLDGNAYSVTLQGGYNVVEQSTLPMVGLNGRSARSYGADQSAKFNIVGTGTSLLAGQSVTTTDDRWLRSVGAEQKLFDNLNVTGKVSETTTGTLNKSLTAGFKTTW